MLYRAFKHFIFAAGLQDDSCRPGEQTALTDQKQGTPGRFLSKAKTVGADLNRKDPFKCAHLEGKGRCLDSESCKN